MNEIRSRQLYSVEVCSRRSRRKEQKFAYGCGFYKVAVLFIIAGFLGDVVETIFCRIALGEWMCRSSVVWGPFNIVWALAMAVLTVIFHQFRNRSIWFLFLLGTVLGGIYEYICSVFTEIVFDEVFWDYSYLPLSLNGRINLFFCFIWGIVAVVWVKLIYPFLSKWIEKIPKNLGKILTWLLLILIVGDLAITSLALHRYS